MLIDVNNFKSHNCEKYANMDEDQVYRELGEYLDPDEDNESL